MWQVIKVMTVNNFKKHWHYIPIYDCMLSKYKDNIKQCEQYYNTHIH